MRLPRSIALAFLPALVASAGCEATTPPASPASAPAPAPAYTPAPAAAGVDASTDAKLRQSLAGPQRTEQERARDGYRHPVETLEFFGLRDDMSVVELSPGGGWYTAVLAPVLRDRGKLFVVGGDPNGDPKDERTQDARALHDRFGKFPAAFDHVQQVVLGPGKPLTLGPAESADMVVTFRNFHNWVGSPEMDAILAAAFAVLKHGGVLGMTDHRAVKGTAADPKVIDRTGYVPEDYVVATIEKAGFKLAGKSEVNANPKDTTDHPKGVWTLPPAFQMGAVDHDKYAAIGESDRMTLRFVKP
jgi:predicted methyltransferase